MLKKLKISIFGIALVIMIGLGTSVKAANLSSLINCVDGIGNITTFNYTYDQDNDITNVKATITLTESVIGTVLNQAPGNSNQAASLGKFYLTMIPTIAGEGSYYNYTNKSFVDTVSVAEAKTQVAALMDVEGGFATAPNVWPTLVQIQYNSGAGWNNITETSNGGKSIKANLIEKLGISSETELVYGENYRFTMSTNTYLLYAFERATTSNAWDLTPVADSVRDTREYIRVTYDIKYPITANVGNTAIYCITLEEAINTGSTNIIINENVTVNNDTTIPKGVTVNIAGGRTLTVHSSSKITNNGTINGTVVGTVETPEPEVLKDAVTDLTIVNDVIVSDGVEYTDGLELVVERKEITSEEETKYTSKEILNKLNETFTEANYTDIVVIDVLDISLFTSGGKLTIFEEGLTIRLKYDEEKYGTENLCILYIGDNGEIEVIPVTVIGNGYIEFTVYHLSEYVLAQGETTDNGEVNPETGDINLLMLSATTLLALVGIGVLVKKLRNKKA